MRFRESGVIDIEQLHVVRMAVKENILNNPALVTKKDYEKYLTVSGKGWLCEVNGKVVGFAIVDTDDRNVWALFVDPEYEKQGIGKKLQSLMLDWYFANHKELLWLSTAYGTRAEQFYIRTGWKSAGTTKGGEAKFEMGALDWRSP